MSIVLSKVLSIASLLLAFASGGGAIPISDAVVNQGQHGIAKYYSAGMFARVARNRGIKLRHDVNGYAAVADCGKIGMVVTASINGSNMQHFQVLDCSQSRDLARHAREGLIIEIDHDSAKRYGILDRGHGPAVIYGYSGTSLGLK